MTRKKTGLGFAKQSRIARASAGHSSGRRKFYAVRGGLNGFSGVVTSWNECKIYVTGVSGVAFKSFRTYDEALAFVQNRPQDIPMTERKSKFYAVRSETLCEVFASWEECNLHIKGIPDVQHKSFPTYEEALKFATAGEKSDERLMNGGRGLAEDVETLGTAVYAGADAGLPEVQVLDADSLEKPEQTEHLVVFTDGACINNGQSNSRAGYGVFFATESPLNISRPLPGRPTNQRAEMMAVLQAIRTVLRNDIVAHRGILEIRTDSQYTKKGLDSWVDAWKRKNWKTSTGANVKNKDLWMALDSAKKELLERGVMLHLVWVKGHAGNPGNEAADRLAVAGIYER